MQEFGEEVENMEEIFEEEELNIKNNQEQAILNPEEDLSNFLKKLKQDNTIYMSYLDDSEKVESSAKYFESAINQQIEQWSNILSESKKYNQQELQKFASIADKKIVRGPIVGRIILEEDLASITDDASEIEAGRKAIKEFSYYDSSHIGWGDGNIMIRDYSAMSDALVDGLPSISLREFIQKNESGIFSGIEKLKSDLQELQKKMNAIKK